MSALKSPGSRAPFPSLIRSPHSLGGAPEEFMGRAFTSIGIVAFVSALGWWQTSQEVGPVVRCNPFPCTLGRARVPHSGSEA